MFSKWLTITLSGVGNDIPTRLGKSRPTLTAGSAVVFPRSLSQTVAPGNGVSPYLRQSLPSSPDWCYWLLEIP